MSKIKLNGNPVMEVFSRYNKFGCCDDKLDLDANLLYVLVNKQEMKSLPIV